MKRKLLLALAVMFLGYGIAKADNEPGLVLPKVAPQSVTDPALIGVDFATATFHFSTGSILLHTGKIALHGVRVSSHANSSDFILFRQTWSVTSNDQLTNNEVFRVYLPTNTFGLADGQTQVGLVPQLGNSIPFDPPIRISSGCAGRFVSNSSPQLPPNSLIYLFQKLD